MFCIFFTATRATGWQQVVGVRHVCGTRARGDAGWGVHHQSTGSRSNEAATFCTVCCASVLLLLSLSSSLLFSMATRVFFSHNPAFFRPPHGAKIAFSLVVGVFSKAGGLLGGQVGIIVLPLVHAPLTFVSDHEMCVVFLPGFGEGGGHLVVVGLMIWLPVCAAVCVMPIVLPLFFVSCSEFFVRALARCWSTTTTSSAFVLWLASTPSTRVHK